MAIGLGLAVGIIAMGLVWFLVPVKYEAYALLRVSERQGNVLRKTGEVDTAFDIFKRTQMQYLLSNTVLGATVRDPKVLKLSLYQDNSDDPISWLKDELLIDYPQDAELLRVAMKGTRKEDVVLLVDKVVEKYLSDVVAVARKARVDEEARLEKEYATMLGEFTKQSEALKKMEQVNKTSATDAAQVAKQLAIDNLYEAVLHRQETRREINEAKVSIEMLEAHEEEGDTSSVTEAQIEFELKNDPTIKDLSETKADYQSLLARHMAVAKDPSKSHPVKQLTTMIQHLEQQIDDHRNNKRPEIIQMLAEQQKLLTDPTVGAMTVPMLKSKIAFLEKDLESADKSVKENLQAFGEMVFFNANVEAKQQELASLRTIMTEVKAQLDRTLVDRLAQERITLVDKATLESPHGDAVRKYVGVAFAGILGFGVVVVGIAFLEFQTRKLNTARQVNDGLGIRVVGELPSVTGRTWRRIKGGQGPAVLKALMAERIDGTRTALIHSTAVESPRVVMVTSADPHEGKTTTSSQLAASLARAGHRTLLIDGDIRNPGVHRVFDMPLEPGLSELLRGDAERDAVVHPTRTANLWLLPAGRCDLRSVQALSTSFLGTTIAALCVQFDYVVIDSGPVLKVADSLLVGQHVDVAILSVLKDSSKVPHVYEACERLRSVGITVMGAVVNGVNDDAARHGVELLLSETTA
jgi:capsular exopolysaccharide synthesis family protein